MLVFANRAMSPERTELSGIENVAVDYRQSNDARRKKKKIPCMETLEIWMVINRRARFK